MRMLTWANALTLARVLCILPLMFAMQHGAWLWAALVFTTAVVSDVFDGRLARRHNQATAFGGLFDHATDATFVGTACFVMAELGYLPNLLSVLIITAFIQYVLDSRALSGEHLRTSMLGKNNGVAYFVVVGVVIGANLLRWGWLLDMAMIFAWILIGTTLISMAERFYTLIRLGYRDS
ncbi:MAG: CDP-alcohol phosphatidyltransferase family protein [Pseudomonadota bacterium]